MSQNNQEKANNSPSYRCAAINNTKTAKAQNSEMRINGSKFSIKFNKRLKLSKIDQGVQLIAHICENINRPTSDELLSNERRKNLI